MTQKTKMQWMGEQHLQQKAGKQADDIVERLGLNFPINPLKVVKSEAPILRAGGAHLGARYDGKLEYNRPKQRFLLFFNTKYDNGLPQGKHHPRTRFSISHELGHYFLDHHHRWLRLGGKSHHSISEFRNLSQIEREADAFAASLLLPTRFVKPLVNKAQITVPRIIEIAQDFDTSLVATAFRSVRLSHFPCALAGIRQGYVAWMFLSDPMFEQGFYPRKGHLPPNAIEHYAKFQTGLLDRAEGEGRTRDWFTTYDEDRLDNLYVTEEYVPAQYMDTLIVLITVDEDDLQEDEDEYEDDD